MSSAGLWAMNSRKIRPIFTFALLVCLVSGARADVRLPAIISDNMVLQQKMAAPIWGWADEGEEVKVTFRGKTAKTKAKDGKWIVKLSRLSEGGPDVLVIEGKNRIEIKNVLVGEVWVASGQSNMEWSLKSSFEPARDIAACANPQLRLFLVQKAKANSPAEDVKGQWKECNPESVPGFSAVAYYFGRDLIRARKVAVGMIGTYWGGSPAEVWMSQQALESNPDYKREILAPYDEAVKKAGNKQPPGWKPTELYNGMIAPIIPYGIKGAIWYQGESNAGRAEQYRSLFADMIRNWRQDWGQGDFTFLAVQLAPWDKGKKRSLEAITEKTGDSEWAELREAQWLATKTLPKVGMAVITDVGDKDDIHPAKKEPAGSRLALAARGIAYGENIEYSGPIYKKMRIKGNQAILNFEHVDGGLVAEGGELKGFSICGPDKKFVWAHAVIQGDTVVVTSPEVSEPVAVRYGWSDFPVVNLWNKTGLPASPFRTDDFPMVTARKKGG
jgi:sialate O-acetylesterase